MSSLLLPTKLQIEICDVCNLGCTYCDVHEAPHAVGLMPLHRFKDLVDQVPSATQLFPQFWGEPTLHPQFEEIVEYGAHKNLAVSFFTNGVALHRRDLRRILASSKLITISLEADSRKAFLELYRRDYYDQVRTNLETLWRTHSTIQSPCRIVIRAIDLSFTESQKAQFVRSWRDLCHEIEWKPLRDLRPGVHRFLPSSKFECPMVQDHCIIKTNGDVVLCCTDRFGSVRIGNVFETSVLEVFNSARFNTLRERVGTLEVCLNCWYRYDLKRAGDEPSQASAQVL